MTDGYCGYGDWPECTDLAVTGGDAGITILSALIGVALITIGIAAWRSRR